MVLLFLRDWRSVIVVVLNIPLALIGSVVALALTGQTVNLMTLGGLALAVGILVDEATVEVENIHTQMDKTDSMAVAVRRGNAETAVPRLLAMLCILAVFIPSFFMQGAARNLFVPLSLAVGFAMITSYLLSSTFVPVLSVWLLRKHHAEHRETHSLRAGAVARGVGALAHLIARWRWVVVPVYLVVALAAVGLIGLLLGREIFPQVDAGQFQFRLRAPDGTRIEQTEEITQEALRFIDKEVGPKNVDITLGYVGVVPASYPINTVYLWMGGPEEAVMRVKFKRGKVRIEDLKRRLRERLQPHLQEWVAQKWVAEGEPEDKVRERVKKLRLSFEPADIVNDVMSFGSPTPIEVAVSGPKLADNRAYADRLKEQLGAVRSLRDLQSVQSLDYPTVEVHFDRQKAGTLVTTDQFANSLVEATSSSRFTVPNFWRDSSSGIGYQVQVEVPQALMRSPTDIKTVPVVANRTTPVLVQDVAEVREGTMPGEIDRYNMRRMVSMTANIEGSDLGHVATELALAIQRTSESFWVPHQNPDGKQGWRNEISGDFVEGARRPATPPGALQVDVRGQVSPMNDMFRGLALGLTVAVVVIFLLLTAYFQSIRLALTSVAAVPAVLCGVVLMLLATRTTINLQSFMCAIMAVGVAVANAILLVTFAERARHEGRDSVEAGVEGARTRLRPILMTSLAMIAGMTPMALGLGEGGDQTAPLGRAVIGGLLASTVATLTLLPAVFALFMGRSSTESASLSPTDPASRYFVPDFNEQL
jgi:multidrug efflux pump subunit AcrB